MNQIPSEVEIRRPKVGEHLVVRDLVQTVVDEIYGGLWTDPPVPIGGQDWSFAWVAASREIIMGMVFTQNEWIDDLWVHQSYRGAGIGRLLLSRAELEIAERGFRTARLRVVSSNRDAIRFYERFAWSAQRLFPHEKFPIKMVEMTKSMPA
jgi:ribosomal protein S18 acetylase RimI-like enzyme